jgi:hypothetical protein
MSTILADKHLFIPRDRRAESGWFKFKGSFHVAF